MRQRVLVLVLGSAITLAGQSKAPVQPKDYGQFETISASNLSPDGKWLAYGITRSNRDTELRVTNVASGTTKTVAFGSQAVFSADSRWVAYGIGYSESQEDKLRKDKKPIHRKLGLMNLDKAEPVVVEGVESFAFSPNGASLAFRRYAPEKAEKKDPAPDASADVDIPAGATLIVRNLATGRDTTFGNVAEFAWQDLPKTGRLLALTISADDKTGNGIQLFDPESGSLRVLDSSSAVYTGLSWRKKSADLSVLRSKTDDKHDGPTHAAMAWSHLGEPSESTHTYDPLSDPKFPQTNRTVSYRKPAWSDDGAIVFLGMARWDAKLPTPKKADGEAAKDKEVEEQPAVDVWHWRDTDVQPKQKLSAKNDRQRNMLCAWHVETGQLVQLGQRPTEQVRPLKHHSVAYAADWTSYAMDRSIGRPAADLSIVDLKTGERTQVHKRLNDDEYLQASPGGRYLLYFENDNYWTVDVATRAVTNITQNVQTSFVNRESDETVKQKPPFGVAGWTRDDAAVILYDKYDLWQISPTGSSATKLTDGANGEVRHRYVKLDPDEEFIDLDKPAYVTLFGIWTKKAGYARLRPGAVDEHLMLADKLVTRLTKAKDADVYQYISESWEQSPNVFVGGPDLKTTKEVTQTNPFQSQYAWGHTELIEYKSDKGERLQGMLVYPAAYETGKKYPMVVYLYEKLSDGLHRYSPPSERQYYSPGAISSHNYFLLMPDIVFRPREPGLSVVECVSAAVKAVIAKGDVDPARIGVVGHSWGGFDTTFLATHTELFAAAVAGAPITDLVSNYGNHHWSSGIAETDHIETGQQRMEVPLWEDLPAYIRNSAVFNVQNMKTPLLIEVGDADGTVFYHQGVELYNVARRAGKNVVLLVYAGEDHGLRKKPDQIDYQHRIFAWFDHYLKGDPAAPWITNGEAYLDRQQELKKLKATPTP